MTHIYFSRFALIISFSLLGGSLSSSEMAQPISKMEIAIMDHNPDSSYVYFGEELKGIISQLSELDDVNNSPLKKLNQHIKNGYYIGECEAVVEALEYAECVLRKNKTLDEAQTYKMMCDLDAIIEQVIDGEFTINSSHKDIAYLPASLQIFDQDITPYSEFAKRLVALSPALVVSTANETLSGLSTIDGVSLAANDRVLLTAQTNPVENGLWLAQSGAWTRPSDFNTGNLADQAYVLISSGSVNAGSSWLCTTPTAVIDTDPITFVLFAYADTTVAANVGSGTGLIFRDKTGTVINLRTLIAGTDINITNNADDITIDTNATSANTASTIVQRDASGRFSAGAISVTDQVVSSSLTVTPFGTAGIIHNNNSGLLSSSLIVNADISASAAIVDSKLATISTAGKVNNSATTANSANLANAIVTRDASGNFSAGTITATLSGNASTATSATTANSATSFTGSLVGDVTGTQGATVVSFVGGQSASNVASATSLANTSTSANVASALVRRSASGGFSAGAISVTDEVISSSLTITPLSTAGIIHNNASGLLSSSLIVNADISASAAIVDTKLATISTAGKVANSATTATGLNTANAIVARDASGNFSAGTIIASLSGSASNNLLKAGDTMTGTLQIPAGTTSAPSLVFTGSTTAGLSASSGNLIFSTNALERMKITSGGTVNIKALTSAGVMHNDASGNLSSSLIVNSDVAAGAAIVDTKLATISTAGKVNNSATTATDANTANAIVKRDSSGNFTAGVVTVVDVTANGNLILTTNPSTSTAGNIFKGTNTPFIHNFGISSTFVGENAGNFSMSGDGQNSILGAFAFGSNSSGNNNTGVGYIALPDCTTGNNNVAIGSGAGGTLTTGSGNIYINANAGAASEATTTRIGTSQTKCFIAGIRGITTGNNNAIAVLIDSAGQLGTVSSSQNVKHDIEDMGNESNNILNLRPVTFVYNGDENNKKQYGLIAEEVDVMFPGIVVKDEEGQPETVQYHVLPVLLLNEMKKQQAIIEGQDVVINNLTITVETMKAAMDILQHQIQNFNERINILEKS